MGGTWFHDVFSQSPTESEIEQVALDAIKHSLGIKQDPTLCHVTVCKVCTCISIPYVTRHEKRFVCTKYTC